MHQPQPHQTTHRKIAFHSPKRLMLMRDFSSNASDLSSNASDLSIRPNVMIGSPLNVISYPGPAGQETLQMYFQSESGNIKGTGQTGSGLWQDAL